MEYANEGDLRMFLSKNFKDLDWNKKFKLALNITNGLYYLHNENILHRDLVSTVSIKLIKLIFIILLILLIFY